MNRRLLDLLVDPISKMPLTLEEYRSGPGGEILEGVLRTKSGRSYPLRGGIPRFVITEDDYQSQTAKSFAFKWGRRHSYDSPEVFASAQKWLVQRYAFTDVAEMRNFFCRRRRILDAGCGSGFSTALWMSPSWEGADWIGVEISAAIDVARERLASIGATHFIQADILQLPFPMDTFDTIFAEGVLHHTPSTELALRSLVSVLEPGGEILFYVYRKKGPVREFTDDYIRSVLSVLAPEQAWESLRPLTKLGRALAELHAEIDVPEDIPYLGIKAGHYDVQRLIYWHFIKLFWNEKFSLEANNHINFDWYHPRYAKRHTEEEIRHWCRGSALSIIHFDSQESGFTVRALKG